MFNDAIGSNEWHIWKFRFWICMYDLLLCGTMFTCFNHTYCFVKGTCLRITWKCDDWWVSFSKSALFRYCDLYYILLRWGLYVSWCTYMVWLVISFAGHQLKNDSRPSKDKSQLVWCFCPELDTKRLFWNC